MAFVSAQNTVPLDGLNNYTYGILVLRTVYKTIVDAANKEKVKHSRESNYWFLDPDRKDSGTIPTVDGGLDDTAIFKFNSGSSTSDCSIGMFLKNLNNDTMLLCFSISLYEVSSSQSTGSICFNPIKGSSGSYSDNSHLKGLGGKSNYYGLGISISRNNFGDKNNPWESGFFSDDDLKVISDTNYVSSEFGSNKTLSIIVGIDGKDIFINRRCSNNSNADEFLCYGNIITPSDNTDTQTDCIFALQQSDITSNSTRNLVCMFRDKSGSTTFYPSGSSNTNNMRLPNCSVNTEMINGSNTNHIPYTGITFGWLNLSNNYPNTTLNSKGVGYKGYSNLSKIRATTPTSIIQRNAVINNQWCCIAYYYDDFKQFKLLVAWDPDNDAIV